MKALLASLALACMFVGCADDDDTTTVQSGGGGTSVSVGDSYAGVPCNAYTEGEAFCADDRTLVYCSLGEWWVIDCVDDIGADFCGEDTYEDTVDCYIW